MRAEGKTLQVVGDAFGITRERVRQICDPNYHPSQWKKRRATITKIPDDWQGVKVDWENVRDIPSKMEGIDRVREAVRIRDGHTCQICKKVWDGTSKRFDIHHLDPDRENKDTYDRKGVYAYDKENTDKMITLCHKCHLRLDSTRVKYTPRAIFAPVDKVACAPLTSV